jgi:hypothetical protein
LLGGDQFVDRFHSSGSDPASLSRCLTLVDAASRTAAITGRALDLGGFTSACRPLRSVHDVASGGQLAQHLGV